MGKIKTGDNQDRSWMKQHHIGQGKLQSVKPKSGRSYSPGELAALGGAAAITGLVGAATVGALREGFGGGAGGRNGNKVR